MKISSLFKLLVLTNFMFGLLNKTYSQSSENVVTPLLNFNFIGGNTNFSNLTPTISYAWSAETQIKKKENLRFKFMLGPYVGSTVNIKDSAAYIPALMLPGNFGLEMNSYLIFGKDDKFQFSLGPSLSAKVISGFTDTSISLIQHQFKLLGNLRYKSFAVLSMNYTWGSHTATNQSEDNYRKLFKTADYTVKYLTVQLQTKIINIESTGKPIYLFISWRKFDRSNLNLPNTKIITIGAKADLEFSGSANTMKQTVL